MGCTGCTPTPQRCMTAKGSRLTSSDGKGVFKILVGLLLLVPHARPTTWSQAFTNLQFVNTCAPLGALLQRLPTVIRKFIMAEVRVPTGFCPPSAAFFGHMGAALALGLASMHVPVFIHCHRLRSTFFIMLPCHHHNLCPVCRCRVCIWNGKSWCRSGSPWYSAAHPSDEGSGYVCTFIPIHAFVTWHSYSFRLSNDALGNYPAPFLDTQFPSSWPVSWEFMA